MRKRVTDEEYNAVTHLTSITNIDQVFDLEALNETEDHFYDFEEEKSMSLEEGFRASWDCMSYDSSHYAEYGGFTQEEASHVANCFVEFVGISEEQKKWWMGQPNTDPDKA